MFTYNIIIPYNLYMNIIILYKLARVAQSVEHWSNKPTVAGSIPVMSNNYIIYNIIILII